MDIYQIHGQLCRTLSETSKVKLVSHDFTNLTSNCSRVRFASNILKDHNVEVKRILPGKDNQKSVRFREEGNRLFKAKKDHEAQELYTKSIACSESKSECLGLAYANRSAVLFQRGFYKECLVDIKLALANNYPEQLLEKLLKRKEKCEKLLCDQTNEIKTPVPPVINAVNERIECATDSVSVKYHENFGRLVTAERDIDTSEVIAVEDPYTKILLKEFFYDHCHNCIKYSLNLIPCDQCSLAVFCSESCKNTAWMSFHKYECQILDTLLSLDVNKLTLVALRISLLARDEYRSVDSYLDDTSLPSTRYQAANYKEVHNLVPNTSKRSASDLFERAVIAAVIYELVEKSTTFFHDCRGCSEATAKETFQELLLLHMQTAPSNFHEISELRVKDGTSETAEIGCGVYSFLSLLNHACSPNVVRICYGSTIVLRALMPISKGDQLLDNYGYHHSLMPKAERRKHLSKQYYFECDCSACREDWPLYQDLESKGVDVGISHEEVLALQKCDVKTAEKVMKMVEGKMEVLANTQPSKELADSQEILKQCMKIFGNVVHVT